MASIELGRIVVKVVGREAGKYACIVKQIDENFVLITGPRNLTGVKRRRANVNHLEPTPYKLNIPEDASDEVVLKAYEEANLISKLGLKR